MSYDLTQQSLQRKDKEGQGRTRKDKEGQGWVVEVKRNAEGNRTHTTETENLNC